MSFESRHDESRKDKTEFFSPENLLQTFRRNLVLLKIAIVLVLALYLFSGITIVGYSESAVVVRLGKVLQPARNSGLVIAFPPPIDKVYKFPTRQIQEIELRAWLPSELRTQAWYDQKIRELQEDPMEEIFEDLNVYVARNYPYPTTLHPVQDGYSLTGDANVVEGIFTIRYLISDPVQYFLTLHDERELLSRVAYQSATQTIAEMGVDELFSERQSVFTAETARRIQERLNRLNSGIRLQGFEINMIRPPLQVISAFQDVISAQVESRTLWEQARGEASTLMSQTRAETRRNLLEAEATRQNLVAQAQGKVAAFEELSKEAAIDPDLFRSRLRLETLERIFGNVQTMTVLPGSSGERQFWLPQESAPEPSPATRSSTPQTRP